MKKTWVVLVALAGAVLFSGCAEIKSILSPPSYAPSSVDPTTAEPTATPTPEAKEKFIVGERAVSGGLGVTLQSAVVTKAGIQPPGKDMVYCVLNLSITNEGEESCRLSSLAMCTLASLLNDRYANSLAPKMERPIDGVVVEPGETVQVQAGFVVPESARKGNFIFSANPLVHTSVVFEVSFR